MNLKLSPEQVTEIELCFMQLGNTPNTDDTIWLVRDWRVLSQEVEVLKRQKAETMKALKDSIANVDKLSARVQELEKVLEWYAETGEPGEFSIVDENRQYISDFHGWGRKAREVLNKK